MRLWTKFVATVAFAGAALAGTQAGADDLGILAISVVGHSQEFTYLKVDVGPDCQGQPLMVKFGPELNSGVFVGQKALQVGTNYVPVSNPHMVGWYTGVLVDGRVKGIEDWDPGCN